MDTCRPSSGTIGCAHTVVMIAKMLSVTAGDLGSEGRTDEKDWHFVRDTLGGQGGGLIGRRGDKKVTDTLSAYHLS